MLTIPGHRGRTCDRVSRRSFLSIGGLALGGLSLPQVLRAEGADGSVPHDNRKAVIMILLPGGPPQHDMFDLKPEAPREIRGEFNPIPTNVPGIEICELMPRLAAIMDRLVVIRSLVGARNDHNVHQCLTGWESHPQQGDSQRVPGYPEGGWPSLGSVASKLLGPRDPATPPFVSLAPSKAESTCRASLNQPGYLGLAHAGFQTRNLPRDEMVLKDITLDRLRDRRALLASFDQFRREADIQGVVEGIDTFHRQAFGILTSSKLAEALDIRREDPKTIARYGIPAEPEFGNAALLEQMLVARRLVETGVRCVTLAFSPWPLERESRGGHNWDWHNDNFKKARFTLPMLDQGVSALVEDLEIRGMLDDVSIVVWGEFGRTPKINRNAGRDHWPSVGNALIAGGGIRAGQVLGATNRLGEYAKERPIHYRDVFATLYHNLGIDPKSTTLTDLTGRPRYLVDNRGPIPELV